ncbi:MAG: TfpX/TfpZ family type IV pilin accessory protein [Burkholderiales bacterium]
MDKERRMTRWRAAGIHLLISACIAVAVLTAMLTFWYPPPLFEAMGGIGLALILVGVDVVLGPTLTLVVFRAGKRGLKLDLTAIGVCQIAALLYGCHVIEVARPAFIVFVKDQFQVATVAQLEPEQLAQARDPQFRSPSWSGPVWVYGEWPKDFEAQQQLVFAGLAGIDLQHFPKHYAPYEEGRAEILRGALSLAEARKKEPQAGKLIDAWLASSGADERNLRYLRLRARVAWVAVLIDRESARPVKMLIFEKI